MGIFSGNQAEVPPPSAAPTNGAGEQSTADDEGAPDGEQEELPKLRASLAREKAAKRKMYSYLVKIADELKALRAESERLIAASEYATKSWHEGGMWRGPNVLPAAQRLVSTPASYGAVEGTAEKTARAAAAVISSPGGVESRGSGASGGGGSAAGLNPGVGGSRDVPMEALVPRAPVSLSDLFLDLVTVTAFTRTGNAIQDRGIVDLPALAYFALFWCIWSKEASYSTRFDTTDLSSQLETLLACFALLGGSLSAYSRFDEAGCNRIFFAAAFVSAMHILLHLRVWRWFRVAGTAEPHSVNGAVKRYATFNLIMNTLETTTWVTGIFLPLGSAFRPWIFLVGIGLNMRLPQAYMASDFHAACSKRGVLFILLLGFNLQSIVVIASPYFNYWNPTWDQYAFLFLCCVLLFAIKLLYVDDTHSVAPRDHALLYNRAAGFFFYLGNFTLLLSTAVLGSGLNLLSQSFLAAGGSLPGDAKNLVCGGFGAVVFSIGFIKSMHIRRVPIDPNHERMFFVAYASQFVVTLAVVYMSMRMCFFNSPDNINSGGVFALVMRDEINMLSLLVFFAALLLAMSWLDEAVELALYGTGEEGETGEYQPNKAELYRVQPFGLWHACFGQNKDAAALAEEVAAMQQHQIIHSGSGIDVMGQQRRSMLAQKSPLLGGLVMTSSGSMFGSQTFAALGAEDV